MSGREGSISKRTYLLSISCLIAGVMLIILAAQSKYVPFHLAFIGALNIVASYSIIVRREWALYLTLFTSLVSLTLGFVTLAAIILLRIQQDFISTLLLIAMTLYVALFSALLVHNISNMKNFSNQN